MQRSSRKAPGHHEGTAVVGLTDDRNHGHSSTRRRTQSNSKRLRYIVVAAVVIALAVVLLLRVPSNQTARNLQARSPTVSNEGTASCTKAQLKSLNDLLPDINDNCYSSKHPWYYRCSLTKVSSCPDATWLDAYYHQQEQTHDKFLAINIGCNKGFDAISLLQRGSKNANHSKNNWKSAMPLNMEPGVCGQDTATTENEYKISEGAPLSDTAQVYCVEPMPSTAQALSRAASQLQITSQFIVAQLAVNNEAPGTALFPSAQHDEQAKETTLGYEKAQIGGCKTEADCEEVHTSTLDFFVQKEGLENRRVHVLLIDVEGYDFEALKGGSSTLSNTEYVEFEYNWRGMWSKTKRPLASAIDYMNDAGFSCYLPGKGQLYRITGCWLRQYEGVFWANVACVNRALAPTLAQKMETVFQGIIDPGFTTKPNEIDFSLFQEHNADRLDEIALYRRNGSGQEELYTRLVVVDSDRPKWLRHVFPEAQVRRRLSFKHATCLVFLETEERKIDREEFKTAARTLHCLRLIVVIPNGTKEEIWTFAQKISQFGAFVPFQLQNILSAHHEVHYIMNQDLL